jgi:hypothetical protein
MSISHQQNSRERHNTKIITKSFENVTQSRHGDATYKELPVQIKAGAYLLPFSSGTLVFSADL